MYKCRELDDQNGVVRRDLAWATSRLKEVAAEPGRCRGRIEEREDACRDAGELADLTEKVRRTCPNSEPVLVLGNWPDNARGTGTCRKGEFEEIMIRTGSSPWGGGSWHTLQRERPGARGEADQVGRSRRLRGEHRAPAMCHGLGGDECWCLSFGQIAAAIECVLDLRPWRLARGGPISSRRTWRC